MTAFKLVRICLHLLAGMWTCACVFPFTNKAGRIARIRRWSARLLALCRVQVTVVDETREAIAPHALIVANHISWLDIFVINTWHPCQFVAKAEIRNWPLIGWLCEKTGTIFIARGKLREVRRIYEGLVHRLHAGEPVAFFPEGTTSEQGSLLPFHSNLFEAAVEAKVPVQPFALRYLTRSGRDRQFHPAVTFTGDTSFADSIIAILQAETIHVELIRLPLIQTASRHRRELAETAQQLIAAALDDMPAERAA